MNTPRVIVTPPVRAAAVCAAAALVLAGCSTTSGGGTAAPSQATSSASTSEYVPPPSPVSSVPSRPKSTLSTVAVPPTASVAPGQPLGTVQSAPPVTAAVLAYDAAPANPYGLTPLTAGYMWRAIQVRVCATTTVAGVSSAPWGLQLQTGTLVTTSEYGAADPNYEGASPLQAGECAEGWVNFGVDPRQVVTQARYAPTLEDGSSAGVFRWTIPAT